MKSIYYSILCLFIFLSACHSEEVQTAEPNLSISNLKPALDSIGTSFLEKGNILGFSIAIDSAGVSIYNGSFGYLNADKTQAVDSSTRFDIASVSKLIGVTVIMKLVEQGKLNLDQTLDQLLPDFPKKELAQKIKLKHLLSHTSGLQDYAAEIDSIFMATFVVPGKEDFLAFFRDKDIYFEPGTHYQYCNSGFMMMAFIAENATGRTWQQLIDEIINEPSGLDFQLISEAVGLPELSPIFDWNKKEFEAVPTWVYVIGDGGLTATTSHLSRFPQYWTKGKILQDTFFRTMVSPQRLMNSTPTGYGLGVRKGEFLGEPFIGHTGGWKTTYSVFAYFPKLNVSFAGLMNTDGTDASMNDIFAEYMAKALGKSIPNYKNENKPVENPENLIGQFHGYNEEFDQTGSIVSIELLDNNQLHYCLDGHCERMYSMGNNKFWLESYPFDFIEFQREENGNISAFTEYYYGFFQVFRLKL